MARTTRFDDLYNKKIRYVNVDGRRLEYTHQGADNDHPTILLHGSPGSGTGPLFRTIVLHWMGVYLVSYSRPGYGGSDRLAGRKVSDEARNVEALADHLGWETFSVLGRSGGGPGALACAALLPNRVVSVGTLASPAPPELLDKEEWFRGMSRDNEKLHRHGRLQNRTALAHSMQELSERVMQDPEYLLHEKLAPDLTDTDRRVLADSVLPYMILKSYTMAGTGWQDDVLALNHPEGWGFDIHDIKQPTVLWHAEHDPFSPIQHAQLLSREIDGAIPIIKSGHSHFSAFTETDRVLKRVRELGKEALAG